MKKNKITFLLVICLVVFTLVSCSCGKRHYKTYTEMETALNEVYVKGEDEGSTAARKTKLYDKVKVEALDSYDVFVDSYIKVSTQSEVTEINDIKNELSTSLTSLKNQSLGELEYTKKASELLLNSFNNAKLAAGTGYSNDGVTNDAEISGNDYINNEAQKFEKVSLLSYLVVASIGQINQAVKEDEFEDYQLLRFEEIQTNTFNEISNIDVVIEESDLVNQTYDQVLTSRANQIYDLMNTFATNIMQASTQPEPIRFELNSFGDFFGNFFDNFLVYPVGLLLMLFSKIFAGKYFIGLLITTIIIRTLGWPIYTKTNDMSLKMKLIEPEQAKIQEKYARRKDEESQRMMQMEMMQLYRKYKVGLGGCLMPFLQFPIFMAVFRAISRLPYTNGFAGSKDWVSQIDSKIFGIDLFTDKTVGGNVQLIGIIILVVLVVGTQILQQVFANMKQKEQQEKAQADIPAYRRKAVQQQKGGMATQMKIMMWTMTGMMGVFVYTSAAGLGVYWLIGNLYAIAQQYINSRTSEKRMEKLKEKHSR